MIKSDGQPFVVERRSYRTSLVSSTLTDLPRIDTPQPTMEKLGDPFKQICNRARVTQVLDGQVESSHGRYPVCLILAQFKNEINGIESSEAVLQPLARLLSLKLRPTDIVMRYGAPTLALILPGADEQVGESVIRRLTGYFDRPITIGTVKVKLAPKFGLASSFDVDQENLLNRAV